MNWFKQTQQAPPIAIVSYIPEYGELGISFRGSKKYVYSDVSPFLYEKINILLRVKNYKEVQKILKNLSAKATKIEEKKQEPTLFEPPKQRGRPTNHVKELIKRWIL